LPLPKTAIELPDSLATAMAQVQAPAFTISPYGVAKFQQAVSS
jgi:hypothetical protein